MVVSTCAGEVLEGRGGVKVLKRIKPTSRAYSAVTTHTQTHYSLNAKFSNRELAVQNIFMLQFYSLSIFHKS